MNHILPPHINKISLSISEQRPSSKKQERCRLRSAIGTASLSATGTSPQEGIWDEKGSVKRWLGLGRPPTSDDRNTSSSGFIFLNRKSVLELDWVQLIDIASPYIHPDYPSSQSQKRKWGCFQIFQRIPSINNKHKTRKLGPWRERESLLKKGSFSKGTNLQKKSRPEYFLKHPKPPTKSRTSLRTCLYASCSSTQASSSEITRGPCSAISKASRKASSFSVFNKKSAVQEDSIIPRSVIMEPVLPRVQSVAPAWEEPGIAGLLERCPA